MSRHSAAPSKAWTWKSVLLAVLSVVSVLGLTFWVGATLANPRKVTTQPEPMVTVYVTPTPATDPCRSVLVAQGRVVTAAEAPIAQWRIHIGAMQKLAAGQITLKQATKFWDDTQHASHGAITSFEVVNATYVKTKKSPVCIPELRSGEIVLALARRTIEQWHAHANDMDLLDKGELSASKALARWEEFYPRGQAQLAAYDEARKAWGQ